MFGGRGGWRLLSLAFCSHPHLFSARQSSAHLISVNLLIIKCGLLTVVGVGGGGGAAVFATACCIKDVLGFFLSSVCFKVDSCVWKGVEERGFGGWGSHASSN